MKNLCKNPVARLCAQMMLDLHNITDDSDITIWDASVDIPPLDSKLNLCVDLQHANNDKIRGWHQVPWINEDCRVIVECEDPTREHEHLLFYDFMWNRSKAYYTQRSWNYRPWYLYNTNNFLLQDISLAEEKTCLFLSPTKPTTEFRSQLASMTKEYTGYSNTVLESNSVNPLARQVSNIGSDPSPPKGYSPVHNAYYRETFFSVYVETIETGTTQLISEKTLDPLIKGHFILPFSAAGFIKYIKQQGWCLPDFIDYGYDQIHDDAKRFRAFGQELSRLCSIKIDVWRQLWLDNQDIIQYNRSQLEHRPYDRLEILGEVQNLP